MTRVRQFLDWYRRLSLSGQLVPLALLGAVYATVVIWYGHQGFDLGLVPVDPGARQKSHTFLTKGKSVLWSVLLVVESAVWFAVAAVYARPDPEPATATRGQWLGRWVPRVLGYAAIVIAFCLPLLYSNLFAAESVSDVSPLLWHGSKMLWLAVPAVTAVVCVIARLRDTERAAARLANGAELAARVATFLALQERLRFALGVLGLMLSLNVLTTGALRNALMYELHKTPDGLWLFNMELVLAFGGAYTFLVIAFYAPVYFALSRAGEAIVDDAAKPAAPATTPDAVLEQLDERDKWETALGLERDWLKSLQAGLVLLSPFFAALAALLLPASK
jgi:hypothetical protein